MLSVDDSVIDNAKEEFETTREQTIQVLNQWRKDNPSKQWRDMKTALIYCKRKDLVNKFELMRVLRLKKMLVKCIYKKKKKKKNKKKCHPNSKTQLTIKMLYLHKTKIF